MNKGKALPQKPKKHCIGLVCFYSLLKYLTRDKSAFELQSYFFYHRNSYIFDTYYNNCNTREDLSLIKAA